MKLPRNLSGEYPKEHHLTVPLHDPLRVGILADVAAHHGITRDTLVAKLFGRNQDWLK